MSILAGAMAFAAFPQQGVAQDDTSLLDYDVLNREVQAISTDLALGKSKLDSSKQDLYSSLCPQADRDLVFAYANLDLARAKIPDLSSRIPRVKPTTFYSANYYIEKLKKTLVGSDTQCNEFDRSLAQFDKDFENRCNDHPLLDAYRQFTSEHNGDVDWLNKLQKMIEGWKSGGGPTTSSIQKAGGGNSPVARFMANPNDPAAASALTQALTSGKNPLSQDDAGAVIKALREHDCATLLEYLKKYPSNPTLLAMTWECYKPNLSQADFHKMVDPIINGGANVPPPATSNTGNTGSTLVPQGNSGNVPPGTIVDMQGNIIDKENIVGNSLINKTKTAKGILTREEKVAFNIESKDGKNVLVPDPTKPVVTVDWQFSIDPTDNNDGFILRDRSNGPASDDKGFDVKSWSVTDPSGAKKEFPGGPQLNYTMGADGKYVIFADVMTKLNTHFTITYTVTK